MGTRYFKSEVDLILEDGGLLRQPTIAYHIWGTPNADGSNLVWVCHALTANSDVMEWWPGLFGDQELFSPVTHCIVCANILGSHYGSSGPLSENPDTGSSYFYSFPKLTVRDLVRAHKLLAGYLGISKIGTLIGGSLGGHQALQWAVDEPDRFEKLVVVASSAVHSPWGIAFNESQRMAIEADGSWGELREDAGLAGMRAARSMALISYRNYAAYAKTQERTKADARWEWRAKSYQKYQGEKLAKRFNALSYYWLSHAMDSHDVSIGHSSIEAALGRVEAETLVISIDSDILFPLDDQAIIAQGITNARHEIIPSEFGHDGFLIETKSLSHAIGNFAKGVENQLLKQKNKR